MLKIDSTMRKSVKMNLTFIFFSSQNKLLSPMFSRRDNFVFSKCHAYNYFSPFSFNFKNLKIEKSKFNNFLSSVIKSNAISYEMTGVYTKDTSLSQMDGNIIIKEATFANCNNAISSYNNPRISIYMSDSSIINAKNSTISLNGINDYNFTKVCISNSVPVNGMTVISLNVNSGIFDMINDFRTYQYNKVTLTSPFLRYTHSNATNLYNFDIAGNSAQFGYNYFDKIFSYSFSSNSDISKCIFLAESTISFIINSGANVIFSQCYMKASSISMTFTTAINCTIIADSISNSQGNLIECVTTGSQPDFGDYLLDGCQIYYSYVKDRENPLIVSESGLKPLKFVLSVFFFIIVLIVVILLILLIIYIRFIRKSPVKTFNGFVTPNSENEAQERVFTQMISHQNGDYDDIIIEDAVVTDPTLDDKNNADNKNRVNQEIEEQRRQMRNEANAAANRRRSSAAGRKSWRLSSGADDEESSLKISMSTSKQQEEERKKREEEERKRRKEEEERKRKEEEERRRIEEEEEERKRKEEEERLRIEQEEMEASLSLSVDSDDEADAKKKAPVQKEEKPESDDELWGNLSSSDDKGNELWNLDGSDEVSDDTKKLWDD